MPKVLWDGSVEIWANPDDSANGKECSVAPVQSATAQDVGRSGLSEAASLEDRPSCQEEEPPSILLTPEEAAEILSFAGFDLDNLHRAGELTVITICGEKRYLRGDVQRRTATERAA
jgi:hypothetical protein